MADDVEAGNARAFGETGRGLLALDSPQGFSGTRLARGDAIDLAKFNFIGNQGITRTSTAGSTTNAPVAGPSAIINTAERPERKLRRGQSLNRSAF